MARAWRRHPCSTGKWYICFHFYSLFPALYLKEHKTNLAMLLIIAGMHRDSNSETMSAFDREMRRRLWCIIWNADCMHSAFLPFALGLFPP